MGNTPTTNRISPAGWLGLVFAMTFPTVAAWLYFLVLAGNDKAYSASKVIQFTFPLVFVYLADGRFPRPRRPHFAGLPLALAFGLLVGGTMLALYHGLLADSAMLAQTPAMVRAKLENAHIRSKEAFLGLAVFIVFFHSLLEEYYWRWFVFDRLSHGMGAVPAAALSALAFMGHHVVILYAYFPGYFLTAVVPFSLGIAVGGAVWAWLYRRSGSIYAPWLSHLVVDAAIFAIGWDMLRG